MKCILPLILALCLPVLAAPALAAEAPAQGTELTNVDSGDCFYAQVQSAAKGKVTTGTSTKEFSPTSPKTGSESTPSCVGTLAPRLACNFYGQPLDVTVRR